MLSRATTRAGFREERGVVMVLLALMMPLLFLMGGIVIAVGSWFTHGRQLQTKVDAAALAAGGVWAFPCGPDSDSNAGQTGIADVAREYVGSHTAADGSQHTSTKNPQVSGVDESDVYVTLNQADWWDDGFPGADFSSPAGSACNAKLLDVKATEDDTPFLFGWLPIWPEVKRKAVVRIEESAGNTGLLPIAVRIPRPLSAAVVFYNEQNGQIISAQALRQVCVPPSPVDCITSAPAGLGQWTTEPTGSSPVPSVSLADITGVVVASSFRPACVVSGATPPCLNMSPPGATTVDQFCNQNITVTCWDATGGAGAQTVQAGVQFIRKFDGSDYTGTGAPQLRSVYLRPNGGCDPYFNSVPSVCSPILTVEVDLGDLQYDPPGPATSAPLTASDVQVRYRIERSDGSDFCNGYGTSCDVQATSAGASGTVTFSTSVSNEHPQVAVDSWENAISLEIRVRNTINLTGGNCNNFGTACRWYYTATSIDRNNIPTDAQVLASPIQRSFMGSLDRTGPLRWTRLDIDPDCDAELSGAARLYGWDIISGADSASRPSGSSPCYVVQIGLQGGMARDQDEPPVGLLLGSGPSQRALVDCDPDTVHGQVADEIRDGCAWPAYRGNEFADPPGRAQWCPWGDDTPGTFFDLPKPAPFDDWSVAFDCVLTRTTGSASQLTTGFEDRFFSDTTNPVCPADDGSPFQAGRNYWHRANNSNSTYGFAWDGDGVATSARGAKFSDADKRLVNLFLTPYGSFTGTGNQVQELVGLGTFYITGFGHFAGGGLVIDDPCSDGSTFGGYAYAGNDPPPDVTGSPGDRVIWGHFLKDVPGGSVGGTGTLCEPELSFNPCTPVLIE